MEKRRYDRIDKMPGVLRYIVNDNQFSIGADTACASIAFQGVFFMTFAPTPTEVIEGVKWEKDVLGIGKIFWNGWKKDVSTTDETFQNLTDIVNIPGVEPFLRRMGKRTELRGPMFTIPPDEHNRMVFHLMTKEMSEQMVRETLYVRLEESLQQMQNIAIKTQKENEEVCGHTTAIIFHGGLTLSLYSHSDGTFIVYDSHGIRSPRGKSSLFRCPSVSATKGIIRGLMSTGPSSSPTGPSNYYNICIFASPLYQKEWT